MEIQEQIFYNHHLGITVPAGWEYLQNHPEKDSLLLDKCDLREERAQPTINKSTRMELRGERGGRGEG